MPAPWYEKGLAFECVRCGRCCRGPGGYVWLSAGEVRDLASALRMTEADFSRKWLRGTPSGPALVDAPNGDCPLLTPDGCKVYAARPVQCRTWPWWPDNLDSPEDWERATRRCPGINRGQVHSRIYIDAELAKYLAQES